MNAPPPTPPRPAPIVFSTDDLPSAERLDAWNAAFGTLNDIFRVEDAADGGSQRSVNWRLGGMVLGVNEVPDTRFIRTAQHVRRDGLDHWVIRVLRRGSNIVRHPGFETRVGPGQPILFAMDETWESEWRGAEWVSLTIPRDEQPQLTAIPRGLLRGAGAELLAMMLLALPGRLAQASQADLPVLTEAARSMVAACLPAGPQAIAAQETAKERVRRAVRANLGSALLTPSRLAALAKLSRSALYRMFEAEGGVASYIQETRLSCAHAALHDPGLATLGIAEIAAAHGFPDPSVFAQAFRRTYGVSPREFRLAGTVAAPATLRKQPAPDGADVAQRLYGRAA